MTFSTVGKTSSPDRAYAALVLRMKPGEGLIQLSADEVERFTAGQAVTKHSGDSNGRFRITLKLTRPRGKAARFEGL